MPNSLSRFRSIFDRQQAVRQAYQDVFNTPAGELVLHDILAAGGILSTSLVPHDPYATHANEGKRALALHIVSRLRWTEAEAMQLALARTSQQLAEQQEDL